MRIVYFSPVTSTVEESSRRPTDMTEARAMVKALFDTSIASFAQILDDEGLVLDNLAPIHEEVLLETVKAPSQVKTTV